MTQALKHDYQIGPELGRGKFSSVHLATSLSTHQPFAVKTISKSSISDHFDLSSSLSEPKYLSLLNNNNNNNNNNNIVALHAVYEDPTSLHLILDLCTGPSLFDLISLNGPLSEPQAASILHNLMRAVATCHKHGVAHRDIKPENILFDGSGRLKLADFGSAGFFGENLRLKGLVGTVAYVAAELARGDGEYGEKVDVWSCGVVMYVMLSGGVRPFGREGEGEVEVLEAVARGNLRFPGRVFGGVGVSREAKELMRKMMCRDAERRLSAEQVLRHPWIRMHVDR